MRELEEIQKSALCEVGNIGSGHAATALAEIVGRRVSVSVPKIWIASPTHIPSGLNGSGTMRGTHFKVLGEPSGGILFVLSEANATKLLGLVMNKNNHPVAEWSSIEQATLKETGLILCAAYLNALNRLMELRLIPSIPKIFSGRLEEILPTAFAQPTVSLEDSVGVLNQFVEATTQLEAYFFFIPEPAGLSLMLERLGVSVPK